MVLFLSKYFSKNVLTFTVIALVSVFLSACVTQEYKADNTPVIVNPVKNDEIAMTRIQLGLGYLKMGNTTQAKLNLEKAKRIAPNLVQVYTAFAHYYDKVGEVDLAINAYEKALVIKSDDADTLNNYGVFLCSQNKIDESEKQLLKAIAVPSYLLVSQSYENIALCQLKVNHFGKAETYFKKSIEHSPNNASALVQMAQLQYAKKSYLKAEQYIKRFEKVTRHFSPVPLALAYKVYSKQGKSNIAKNYAAMLVKMFPRSNQSKQYLHNGLAHIEADTLAEKYQQLLALQHPTKSKKRVIKLSPHNNGSKKATLIGSVTYKPPFKVKSELNRLPISRSVTSEEVTDVNNKITKNKDSKSNVSPDVVISDEMMDALINDNSDAILTNNHDGSDRKILKDAKVDYASDSGSNDVSGLVANDIKVDDASDNASNDVSEQEISDLVANDIKVDDASDNASNDVSEQEVGDLVANDIKVDDVSDNASNDVSEQEISDIVTKDVNADTVSNDATDKAIDEAINNLVANDASYVTDVTNRVRKKTTLEKRVRKNTSEPLTYVVKKNQNLFYISRTYNIRLSALRRWNHLTKNSVLQIGDVIHLTDPVAVKDSNKVQPYND